VTCMFILMTQTEYRKSATSYLFSVNTLTTLTNLRRKVYLQQ
jgi:hypothetical protein